MAAPQPPALAGYQPANDVEYQLAHARGDATVYLRVLRGALLYVPVVGQPEDDAQGPPAWRHGGVPHVAVFTSLDTMRLRVVGIADAYRVIECADLVAQWPDATGRLAVNPGTPIGAYLPVAALTDAAAGRSDLVEFDPAWTFRPANPFENVMYLARNAGRPETFLDALVVSRALMPTAGPAAADAIGAADFPWLLDIRAPSPVINVFTSPERLTAAGYEESRAVSVDLIALVKAWPDTRFWLAVNAGSAIATLFAGDQVARLVDWAEDLVRRRGIGRVASVD
ncbi:MAG: hypothetical protein V7603_1260 [Micromonosporaceae bacterium]